jgi:hypothetical protein
MADLSLGVNRVLISDERESTFLVSGGLDNERFGEERGEFAQELFGMLVLIVVHEVLGFVVDEVLAFAIVETVEVAVSVELFTSGFTHGGTVRRPEQSVSVQDERRLRLIFRVEALVRFVNINGEFVERPGPEKPFIEEAMEFDDPIGIDGRCVRGSTDLERSHEKFGTLPSSGVGGHKRVMTSRVRRREGVLGNSDYGRLPS